MHQKLAIPALLSIIGLAYLAINPTPLVRAMDRAMQTKLDVDDLYAKGVEGTKAGDPYWTLQLGLNHRFKTWLPDEVEPDSAYSIELIERAMDGGLSMAGYWYYATVRTRDALERAARSGEPSAIGTLAFLRAQAFCDEGRLPEGTMQAFLDETSDAMNADRQAELLPKHLRRQARETLSQEFEMTRIGILQGIPEHFQEMCSNPAGFDTLLPRS